MATAQLIPIEYSDVITYQELRDLLLYFMYRFDFLYVAEFI